MPSFLVPVEKGQTIALDKAIMLFGRHPDCDVVLARSRKVSRKHCCVAQVDNRYVVRDLGSMNGVRVNGDVVTGQRTLHAGDELAVGDVIYRLVERETGRKKPGKVAPETPRKKQPTPRPVPSDLSQEIPIAIPEEEQSFLVELSQDDAQRSDLDMDAMVDVHDEHEDEDDEVIELSDEDIVDL